MGLVALESTCLVPPVLIVLVVLGLLFYQWLKRPTHAGRALMDGVEGLRMCLRTAESDRVAGFESPEKTPEPFERLLPYAIALDVENEWTKRFDSVFADAARAGGRDPTPSWYCGSSLSSIGSLSSSLGSAMTSAISSASSAPGARSGSGGGRSSGGGGGW